MKNKVMQPQITSEEIRALRLQGHNPPRGCFTDCYSRAMARRPISLTKGEFSTLNAGHTATMSQLATVQRLLDTLTGKATCAGEPETTLDARPHSGSDSSGSRAVFRDMQRGAETRAMKEERAAKEAAEAQAVVEELKARDLLAVAWERHLTSAETAIVHDHLKRIKSKDLKELREAKARVRAATTDAVIGYMRPEAV